MFSTKKIVFGAMIFLFGFATAFFCFRDEGGLQEAAALGQPEIIFYSEPNFTGRELHVYEDTVDLPFEEAADGILPWNDSIRSIVVVSGTWRLYQHGRMNTEIDETPREFLDVRQKAIASGWSGVLSANSRGPVKIASPELAGIGEDVSSVQLLSAENLPDWLYEGR